jgi:hypothetical protein
MFCLKLVEKDKKCILSTITITYAVYTVVHFINVGLNRYCIENEILDWSGNIIQVNYMYSIKPENPLLQLFYNILPYSYWYMLLCIPIIIVYLSAIYGKQIVASLKQKK